MGSQRSQNSSCHLVIHSWPFYTCLFVFGEIEWNNDIQLCRRPQNKWWLHCILQSIPCRLTNTKTNEIRMLSMNVIHKNICCPCLTKASFVIFVNISDHGRNYNEFSVPGTVETVPLAGWTGTSGATFYNYLVLNYLSPYTTLCCDSLFFQHIFTIVEILT